MEFESDFSVILPIKVDVFFLNEVFPKIHFHLLYEGIITAYVIGFNFWFYFVVIVLFDRKSYHVALADLEFSV